MSLSSNQIKERLKRQKHSSELSRASNINDWLSFHIDSVENVSQLNSYFKTYISWINKFIPPEKQKRIKELLVAPISTNELCESIFDELGKIWETKDRNVSFSNVDQEQISEFKEYLNKIGVNMEYWQSEGYSNYQNNVNSFVVVDLPSEQTTDIPEPYAYIVEPSQVADIELTSKGDIRSMIFTFDDKTFYLYDDESYQVYEKKGDVYILQSENAHDLGYAPVHFFWNDKLNKKTKIIRKNPVVKSLSQLDWGLLYAVLKKYLDLYAPMPIIATYEQECDYKNESGHHCEGGYLCNTDNVRIANAQGNVMCPSCGGESLIAPGSLIETPVPENKEDFNLMPPVQVISAAIDSCEYVTKEVERINAEIFTKVIGEVDYKTNNQAKNEMQVMSSLESRKGVLDKQRHGFEIIINWTYNTIAKLRYNESFGKITVSLGQQYFLTSTEDMQSEYVQVQEGNFSDSEIDRSYMQVVETKYKNNPNQLDREKILIEVNPFPYMNTLVDKQALKAWADAGDISQEDYRVKIQFNALIKRFERENAPVTLFGANLPFEQRIRIIQEELRKFVRSVN